ncbi:MAG: TetR/AcrR family transcriptional regulator [Solirubrobacteraceae bacterium]
MPRTKQRTPELRDRVLAAAVELLAREGIAGFTARAIAIEAETSTPAIYELFGDKAGVVREVFFEGFRLLRRRLDALSITDDPRADLLALAGAYRDFIHEYPALAQLMFLRPFADFDPGKSESRAGESVREFIIGRVRSCVDAGLLHGDETDIAHALVALTQGLATAENSKRLGTTRASIDRRWALAMSALLDGLQARASGMSGT